MSISRVLPSVQSRSSEFRCEVVTEASGLAALREEWTELVEQTDRPTAFLSWEWMTTWLHAAAADGRPHVVLVRRRGDNRLDGLAPLWWTARGGPLGLSRLTFMGTGVGADHLMCLARRGQESAVHDEIVRSLVASPVWDVLDCPRMDEQGAAYIARAIAAWGEGTVACAVAPADVCPFLTLPPTWEDLLRAMGKHHRKDLARRWRRLRDRGRATVHRVETPEEFEQAWASLLDLHRRRQGALRKRSAFLSPRSRAFHHAFARLALARGWLRFYLLQVDGQTVAAEYCLQHGRRIYDLQTGFDMAWARFGVGTLLLGAAIEAAIAEGAVEFDLLRGGEAYKQQRWTAQMRTDVSLLAYRQRPRVRAAVAAQRWGVLLKALMRQAAEPTRLRG